MNSKIHMVVIEVVSQNLEEHKNNGLICKLQEILSGQIWVYCLVWFLIKHGLIFWLRNFYGLYWTYRGVVCKISWQLEVSGQPVCILQMEHMLLEWAVNNIYYTRLCGFNSQVRANVLSYNLIRLSFGMSRS